MITTANKLNLSFRPVTLDDAEAATDLFNACSIDLIGQPDSQAALVRGEWQTPGFDLATDTRVAHTPDGSLVGYAEVWDGQAQATRVFTWACVHPDYRGRGLGTALRQWAEERAHRSVAKAPEGTRVVMLGMALGVDDEGQAILKAQGMEITRYYWRMVIDFDGEPPAPDLPDGIDIRPVGEDETRALYAAIRDSFKDHYGYVDEPFEVAYERWIHFNESDPACDRSLWFVAVEGSEIAGVSVCVPTTTEDPQMGWISTLGVRRPWRRRGLGLALLRYSLRALHGRGLKRAGLAVDAESLTGATRLYEKAGMRVERETLVFEKELRPGVDLSTQSIDAGA